MADASLPSSVPEPPANAGVPASPGVLYFDPNPTTAKLATAGLRLAGYSVWNVSDEATAVEVCRLHGPGGDKTIGALLLDTANAPEQSAQVLRALLQVPGASELPGMLLVSRSNPTPFPGAESLPSLKRPFTTPALLKVLRDAITSSPGLPAKPSQRLPAAVREQVLMLLLEHFDEVQPEPEQIEYFASALLAATELPPLASGVSLQTSLEGMGLASILSMLDLDGARGVLEIVDGEARIRLHLDVGRIRMAETTAADEDLRLGRFVVEAGFMSNEALEAEASSVDPKHRPLGLRLLEGSHLRRGELARVLVNQAREVVCHALQWRRGQVSFSPSDVLHPLCEATAPARSELSIGEALLEGLRRVEAQAEMGPDMAGVDDVYVREDEAVARLGRHAFTREELGVLELLNGRNSVKEIARKTRTGTFAVAKILYRLSRARLVHRRLTPVEG